jgi:hypothetical protein
MLEQRRVSLGVIIVITIGCFGLLWALGYPMPFDDDIFYCGAGLNLAHGGDFSNPFIVRQLFPSHYFFAYPPLYPYAVGGWLKVFGISATALTGFHIFLYCLVAGATIAILRRHGARLWMQCLVPLAVTTVFTRFGLRPEPLAVGFTMVGFAFIECGGRRPWLVFLAFLLMFLGGSVAPRLTPFSGVLAVLAGYRLWQDFPEDRRRQWSFLVLAGAALLVAVGMFLWMIDFKLAEFLTTLRFHASVRVNGGSRIESFMKYPLAWLTITQWPLLVLMAGLFVAALRNPKDQLSQAGLFLTGAFPLVALIRGMGHGTLWYIILIIFLLSASLLKRISGFRTTVLQAALILTLIGANTKVVLEVIGILSGNIRRQLSAENQVAAGLKSTPDHPVLVDCWAARYVFDYRIPEGHLNFEFSSAYPGTGVKDGFFPGDIYVVGAEKTDELDRITYLERPVPRWSPVGRRWSYYRDSRAIFIIPAETCKGLRPKEEWSTGKVR